MLTDWEKISRLREGLVEIRTQLPTWPQRQYVDQLLWLIDEEWRHPPVPAVPESDR